MAPSMPTSPAQPHEERGASAAKTSPQASSGLMGTPKGMRMTIGLFGRRNVGKSSVLNSITHQQTSIVSPVAGTTTDPIEKPMELLPLGPVLFVDTAGIDDDQETIGQLRSERTRKVFDRCDLGVIVTEHGTWGPFEDEILDQLERRNVPTILVLNKCDLSDSDAAPVELDETGRQGASAMADAGDPSTGNNPVLAEAGNSSTGNDSSTGAVGNPGTAAVGDLSFLPERAARLPRVLMSAINGQGVLDFRQALLDNAPEEFVNDPTILGDVVAPGSVVILVIPIDKEAPKGRLILPQAQTIRDLLDSGCMPLCVTDEDLPRALSALAEPPALVVTDSQAFGTVSRIVPDDVPLTSFSVAFARFKGDLATQALGTLAIKSLTEESRVLIAEACTHHPIEEDIGTVKIPRLLRKRVGEGLAIDNVRGRDFPDDLSAYDLVIHCGGCMFNRRSMLSRVQACVHAGVPVSNYGLTLAYLNGVFERSIQVFPDTARLVEECGK